MARADSILYVEQPSQPSVRKYIDFRPYYKDFVFYYQGLRSMADSCGQVVRLRTKNRLRNGQHQYTRKKVVRAEPGPIEFYGDDYSGISDGELKFPVQSDDRDVIEIDPPQAPIPSSFAVLDEDDQKLADEFVKKGKGPRVTRNQAFQIMSGAGWSAVEFNAFWHEDCWLRTLSLAYVNMICQQVNYKFARNNCELTRSEKQAQLRSMEGSQAKWVIEQARAFSDSG